MTDTERKVVEIVEVQLGRRDVQRSDHLQADLGADSADLLNLVLALEDRFGMSIGEEEVAEMQTVEDVLRLVSARATG